MRVVGAFALALMSTAAGAADLAPVYKGPVAPMPERIPFSWTGFYFGGNFGGDWGQKEWDWRSFHTTTTRQQEVLYEKTVGLQPQILNTSVLFNPPIATPFPVSGFLGGFQAGYRYQLDVFVFGIEGSFDWTNLHGRSSCGFNVGIPTALCDTTSSWMADFTGQVGFTSGKALLYLKGGGALIHETNKVTPQGVAFNGVGSTAFNCVSCSDTETRLGALAGAGVTYAFASHWSAFLEYNYLNFGTKTLNVNGTIDTNTRFDASTDVLQQVHLVKAGVNYKIDFLNP